MFAKPDKKGQLRARVLGRKELAATRWAQHVSAQTGIEWQYLLVGETAVAEARGSWPALRKLAEL